MTRTLTVLQLGFFGSRQRHETRQPLSLSLLLVDLGPELVGLSAELLSILLKRDEFVPPEIRFGHQEVEPPRQTANLCLEVVPCIYERRGALADGMLDKLLRNCQLRRTTRGSEHADTFQERRLLEL